MITARKFLEEAFKQQPSIAQRNKYYLYLMTKNLDKTFIVDTNTIHIELIPVLHVFKELTEFIKYYVFYKKLDDLNTAFYDYLVC